MSVEQGFIEYVFEQRGADAVRREFDKIADATKGSAEGMARLDKIIQAVSSRAPRLAASLTQARNALAAYNKEVSESEKREAALQKLNAAKKSYGTVNTAGRQADRKREIGGEAEATERLAKAEERVARASADIARIKASGRSDVSAINAEASAYKNLERGTRQVTTAKRDLANATEESTRGLASQRYALYDISSTYAIVGAAMVGAGIYATVMGAQFESAFTSVERTLDPLETTSEGIEDMRQSLMQLQGELPLTFAELSKIATIGNQMGIAADGIISFTGTVARFSEISGESIESVTQSFGGLAAQTGLNEAYFENLASSIALVAISSNATDKQIMALTKELAAGATTAGFTIDQIVGLAGALASLQVPPERARGAIDMYFERINAAVATGGSDLTAWAAAMGKSAEQVERMARSGDGAELLTDFIDRLQGLDPVEMTEVFSALDTDALRLANTLRKLGLNSDLLKDQLALGKQGFIDGGYAIDQYSKTLDDLNTQWTIFINGINSVIATITGGAVPGLAGLLSMVNNIIYAFQAWLVDNPWAARALTIGTAFVAITGTLLLLRGITFRAQAAMLAFRLATAQAAATGVAASGGLRSLAGALFGVGNGARAGAGGLRVFRAALVSTGIGAAAVGIGFLAEKFIGGGGAADDAALSIEQYNDAVNSTRKPSLDGANAAKDLAGALGGGGGGGGVSGAAEKAVEKIRTLIDYANDLSGVFKRASSLRFDAGDSIDKVTLKWIQMNEQMEEYQRKVRSLTADRSLKAYWLGIAEAYNDQLRASQLREEIAKIDDELAEANAGASTELQGNSKAAIENRVTMAGLVRGYEDYLIKLAESGASQQTLQDESRRLRGEFVDQARQLGYNASEVDVYAKSFGDMSTIIANVPRDVTIDFNGDPAELALAEFFSKVKTDAAQTGSEAGGGLADGMGGALDGVDFGEEDLFGDLSTEAKKTTDGIDKFFNDMWWNIGHSMIRALGIMYGALGGFLVGLEYFFSGKSFKEGFNKGFEGWDTEFRDQFGAIGFFGADAMEKEFKKGVKPGQWIADGVTYEYDLATNAMKRVGVSSAEEYQRGLKEGVIPGPVIVDNVNYAKDWITGEVYKVGSESGKKFSTGVGDTSKLGPVLSTNISGSSLQAYTLADSLGRGVGTNVNSGTGKTVNTGGVIGGNVINAAPTVGGSALNLGISIANKLKEGATWALNLLFGGSGTKARSLVRDMVGFSAGGYTGPGHWQKPAGMVHAGEYVIPKKHVDQRTGTPNASYVQSLNHGKAAPKMGYASGGFAGGGTVPVNVVNAVELGVRSLHAIGNSGGGSSLTSDMIGNAASHSFEQKSLVGAN